jgi:hypothetical protein
LRIQTSIICCTFFLAVCSSACGQQRTRQVTKPVTATAPTSSSETALANIPDLVQFPSAEVEFIAGPQLKARSALNPAPWFDQTALSRGLELGNSFPTSSPQHAVAGTLSLTKGSKTVIGTNTHFRSDFAGAPYTYHIFIHDSDDVPRDYIVVSVEDDTRLTISLPWEQSSATGRSGSKATGDEFDQYINLNYYDQGFCQYVNYYRSGDPRFLAYARKITDSWWNAPFIAEGHAEVTASLAPRNVSLNGLMMRALDGRPEMWSWITKYVREQFDTWVGLRVSYPGFYYGVRDPGYMLLFAANLAKVHPDQKIRAEFQQKALNAAMNYYARLQAPDGGFYFELDNIERTTQPFQVGLLAEGLIAVHRLTHNEVVGKAILKSAEHQYLRCFNPRGWRGMYYFIGGKTKDKGESCEKGCGAAANQFPPSDPGSVSEVRQLNGTAIHQFGYAYLISKDAKYRQWGDDIFDATFSGRDGYRGLAAARAKEYSESFRSAGKYLAWRLAFDAPAPTSQTNSSPTTEPALVSEGAKSPLERIQQNLTTALTEALRLASAAPSASELESLMTLLSATRTEAIANLENSSRVRVELDAALEHLRVAQLILKTNGSADDVKLRVSWAAARLKRAGER